MGSIRKRGNFYYIRYYDHRGIQVEENTKRTTKAEAKRQLNLREGALARGEPLTAKVGKITVGEALASVVEHYETNGLRSLSDAKRRIEKHLLPHFVARRRMTSITSADVRKYHAKRQKPVTDEDTGEVLKPGASNASINREVALLKRAFRLAAGDGLLIHVPHLPMLKEASPRQGFLEPEAYAAIRTALPNELRGLLVLGFWSGWRKSEILSLQWRQVDRRDQVIRLAPGTTKDGGGRSLPYSEVRELTEVIERQWEAHNRLRSDGVICPFVFHRDGEPIRNFRRAWLSACKAAGVPGTLFHDLRRTAARNLIRAGVNEKLAMEILGHRTPSVFKRYAITNEDDKREALGAVVARARAKQGQTGGIAQVAESGHRS